MIEAMKQTLADAKRNERHNNVAETRYWLNQYKLIAEQAIAELENQEPVAVYGYCPECGAKGVMRERRPDGNDRCANGHTYQSCKAIHPPQRTWVGLTGNEMISLRSRVQEYTPLDSVAYGEAIQRATAQALKEKNT